MVAQARARGLDRPARARPRSPAAGSEQFGLHELAIEDALKAHQRPKLEQYGEALFVVAERPRCWMGASPSARPTCSSGRATWSPSVTAPRPPTRQCASAARRLPKSLSEGEDFILYAILDFIVDNYMPVIEAVQSEVEEIEDGILAERPTQIHVRPALPAPAGSAASAQCRRSAGGGLPASRKPGLPGIDAAMYPLFRDVSDHIRRVQEEIESLREVLAFAFETSLMTGQAQQTEITRKLAAWAAILAVPTAVAGIYGMNFEVMPELQWRYGYVLVLTVIIGVCGWLYWRFRRNGWL